MGSGLSVLLVKDRVNVNAVRICVCHQERVEATFDIFDVNLESGVILVFSREAFG